MPICARHRQRGDMLLEALIGVLLTALIAGGMAHLTARLQASQWEVRIQGLLVDNVRNQLQAQGLDLCNQELDQQTLPVSLVLATVPVFSCTTPDNVMLTLDGTAYSITPPEAIQITLPSAALGVPGPDLVMGTQQ